MEANSHARSRFLHLRHLIGEHQKRGEDQKYNRTRSACALKIKNHVSAQEPAVEKMNGFRLVMPQFIDQALGMPKPSLKFHLADKDERDQPEVNALIDKINGRVDTDKGKNVKNEPPDKEENV